MKPFVFALLGAALLLCKPSAATAAECQKQIFDAGAKAPSLCSKSFYFEGDCTGQDELALWHDDAAPNAPTKVQPPWETFPISIVGATIAWLHQVGGFQYAFIGNSYDPDAMLWARNGDAGATSQFWAPYAFQFPAIGAPNTPHVDLHVACTTGRFVGYVTIIYLSPDTQADH
jgi:hypothetical protein